MRFKIQNVFKSHNILIIYAYSSADTHSQMQLFFLKCAYRPFSIVFQNSKFKLEHFENKKDSLNEIF